MEISYNWAELFTWGNLFELVFMYLLMWFCIWVPAKRQYAKIKALTEALNGLGSQGISGTAARTTVQGGWIPFKPAQARVYYNARLDE